MKKIILMSMLTIVPYTFWAQDDDMYFVPTKKNVEKEKSVYGMPADTYYSGSERSVDEYNRRTTASGSSYELIRNDSTIDEIHFSSEVGVYPADTVSQDFSLTRRMSRWEEYTPSEAYWDGYNRGRSDEFAYSWHSPWYYSTYYPWYDRWYYDPWYYGYYDPWYYRHYGYWGWSGVYYGGYYHYGYYPYYGGWGGSSRTRTYARNGNAGTISRYGNTHGRFSGGRGSVLSASSRQSYGTTTASSSRSSSRTTVNRSGSFSGARSSSGTTYTPSSSSSRSYSSSSSSSGNFGGSRGTSGGGGRSGSIGGSSRGGGRR